MTMKAVIFDMDGVLVDSMKYHIYAWKRAFKQVGIDIPDEMLYMYEGADLEKTLKHFSEKFKIELTLEQKKEVGNNKIKYTKEVFKIFIYDFVKEIVEYVKSKGMKTGVVTGSNKIFAEFVVNKEFSGMFDFMVTANDVSRGKPAPDPYLKAVEILNLPKEDLVVIENAPLGIESAKRAGLKVFALETTVDKHYLGHADKIFSNHEKLLNYFKEII